MGVVAQTVERVFREESGVVLASLIATVGDFDLAEDAFQDAVAAAAERWPGDGVPRNPAAWLTTTARRKAIDRERRATVREQKRDALRVVEELTRLVEKEIARAFLVPEATLAQRLARAKRKIADAGIPYRVPEKDQLAERLDAVLAVLYLIFNEGYSASSGEALVRRELCNEAIRMARVLCALLPDEPENLGLLALMLLHDSRREARVDAEGVIVPLEEQDRDRWDRERIDEGRTLLEHATALRRPGPYQIQAAISAVHATCDRFEDTDWRAISALYASLERVNPSPVVTLNRAVAVAMALGPEHGLALIDEAKLSDLLARYQPYHATRADLLRRLGRSSEAAESYQLALELTNTEAERRFLEQRLAAMSH